VFAIVVVVSFLVAASAAVAVFLLLLLLLCCLCRYMAVAVAFYYAPTWPVILHSSAHYSLVQSIFILFVIRSHRHVSRYTFFYRMFKTVGVSVYASLYIHILFPLNSIPKPLL
jgi:hypothetical protein